MGVYLSLLIMEEKILTQQYTFWFSDNHKATQDDIQFSYFL